MYLLVVISPATTTSPVVISVSQATRLSLSFAMAAREFLFTSESVTEGHPDKVADQISDSVLDAVLADDPTGRVACETLITTGLVVVAGEITTETYVDIPALVRKKISEIGYTHSEWGFDAHTCGVVVAIDEQSPDIAQGVDESFERQHDPSDDDPLDLVGAGLSQTAAPFESALGVSLKRVLELFQNENAIWVRPGAVIPEFTAILQPDDTTSGLATLDKLMRFLAGSSGATVAGGVEKTLSYGKQFQLHYGAIGSKLVLTSAPGGIENVGSPSENLADSADFTEATGAAGMPSSNGGFLYVDLKNAIPLIEGFASLSGSSLPSSTTENLRPLRSFLSWSAGSGDARTFDAFLEIK